MPAKIEKFEKLIKSTRFINAVDNRIYTDVELEKIRKLFDHIKQRGFNLVNGQYITFCQLVKYDLENLIERFDWLVVNSRKRTKEASIIRHGEIIGIEKWNNYCEKQRVKNLYESKQEKYGWTKDQFDEFNKSRAVTYKNCIERHGIEEGQRVWDHYVYRQRYTNSIEYFTEKYSDDGYEKWLDYNKEKSKSGKIDWIMEKYNLGEEAALEILSSRLPKSFSSTAELSFIDMLESCIGYKIKYTAKTNQFCIWNTYLNKPCFYDITDAVKFKIIEFHGDYWHCNPLKYSADFLHPHTGFTAKEIWNRDYFKLQSAIDRGFEVRIVWWSEFENYPQKTIEECSKWWNT